MQVEWATIARRIRVPVAFVFAGLYVWLARPTPVSITVGIVISLAGLWLRALASGHVRKNEQLATTGPYAHTRNPLYLGSVILAVGLAIAGHSWRIVTAMVVIFVAIYLPVIRSEEDFLRGTFPEFGEYAARVPRLLPRWRGFSPAGAAFSWSLYRKHREYNAILGAVGIFAVLLLKLLWVRH